MRIIYKLDYTLKSPLERKKLVERIIEENPNLNNKELERLADYLIMSMDKEERKQKKILTENRMVTINRREKSFEGLVSKFPSGEDGVYGLAVESDKNTIFQPKISISKENLENIPYLAQIRNSIALLEKSQKTARGKDAYILKKAIIELKKDQYLIKQAFLPPVGLMSTIKYIGNYIKLEDFSEINEKGRLTIKGISLMNPTVCSVVLCNYSKLRENSFGHFEGDTWYLMEAFDKLAEIALAETPIYERIVTYKIDGMKNADIQREIENEFNIRYSFEHISSLWRTRIPKMIARCAREEKLSQWYIENNMPLKKCSYCGQNKPLHIEFFSSNSASKDRFYSICKRCRAKKRK